MRPLNKIKINDLLVLRNKNRRLRGKHSIEALNQTSKILDKHNNKNINNDDLVDLTHLITYTIDSSETFEVDDAISLEISADIPRIWIHITSPSRYIEINSPLDIEARERASSIYLINKISPMFPKKLSQEFLSISNIEPVNTLSACIELNEDGSISKYNICKAKVKATYRINYEEADELIELAPKEDQSLTKLNELLKSRRNWRTSKGSIDLTNNEAKIVISENNIDVKFVENSNSRSLVEESMILMGTIIAEYCKQNCIPVPFRCQDKPSSILYPDNKIQELKNYSIINSLKRSYLSIKPNYHFTLGISAYVQCTSPLRRYIDFITHHQLMRHLDCKKLIDQLEIQELIDKYLPRVREANEIMREDKKFWQKVILSRSNSVLNAYFIKWINYNIRLALVHFCDYSFEYIIKLRATNNIEYGEKVKLNLLSKYYELEDYRSHINMSTIN